MPPAFHCDLAVRSRTFSTAHPISPCRGWRPRQPAGRQKRFGYIPVKPHAYPVGRGLAPAAINRNKISPSVNCLKSAIRQVLSETFLLICFLTVGGFLTLRKSRTHLGAGFFTIRNIFRGVLSGRFLCGCNGNKPLCPEKAPRQRTFECWLQWCGQYCPRPPWLSMPGGR